MFPAFAAGVAACHFRCQKLRRARMAEKDKTPPTATHFLSLYRISSLPDYSL
jgi:hypothetical protein